jgi:hypothetical protein
MSCWLLALLLIYTKPIDIAKCRQRDLQSHSTVVLLARSLSCGVKRASSLLGPSEFRHTLAAALDSQILECGREQSVCRSDRGPKPRQRTCGFPTCRLQRFTHTHTHTAEYQLRLNLLKTKRNLLYIRNQSVPRCKHFPPRL